MSTILFKEDWMKHPYARIHYETENTTFLKLAEIYHKMGIENCAFHLAIHDPMLIGVNPHDEESLTMEQKFRIIRECKENIWYFLREILRVSAPGRMDGAMFRANRSNIALFWLYMNHITTINTVIRQTGKTTNLVSLFTWLMNFGTVGSDIGLLTKDSGLKAETMGDLKEQFEYLPDYLNMSTKRDVFNSDIVNIEKLNNSLVCKLSSASPKQADKVGRGHTISTLAVDECAFVSNIGIALPAFTLSGNAARTMAREQGKPYGTILTTTAGKIDDRDGRFIYELLSNGTLFSEIFFDAKNEDELNEIIAKNTSARNPRDRKPIVNLTLTYRQMGYSDEWMKRKLEEASTSSPENLERDMFNKWSVGSQVSPISPEDAERLNKSKIEDPRIEMFAPFNYILRWYLTEEEIESRISKGNAFIIGVDTSDGAGRDDITFYVRDSTTGEIVCTGVFNEINLITLSNFFVSFLVRFGNSVMIIERRSSAAAIIDNMITQLCNRGINPFKRMYNSIVQNKEIYTKEFAEVMGARPFDEELFIRYKSHIGFKTSGQGLTSRNELYGTGMYNALRYTAHLTKDSTVIDQLLQLVIKNGRVDHPSGGRDDAVVAWLLGYWLLFMGRNLNAYGINITTLLKANDVYLNEKYKYVNGEDDGAVHLEEIEEEVNELMEMIKSESNLYLVERYAQRIRFLYKDVVPNSNYISVEELLENITKENRLKRSVAR